MIDFHSHILPGIDDGSRDINESIALLKEAKEAGFDRIISTSHYCLGLYEANEEKRIELIRSIKEKIDYPEIFLGSEIYSTVNMVNLIDDHEASRINNTKYVLIEVPLHKEFPNFNYLIDRLHEEGYFIILAHPERYRIVQNDFKILEKWKNMDIYFQSNYGSILGAYGCAAKKTMIKMLKKHLVTFLGTDVHRQNTIYNYVPKAITKMSKIITEEYLNQLTTENAEKVLRGEYI